MSVVPRGDLVPSGILGLLGTQGPTSRVDIARSLGLSPATVTQVIKDLLARGLVEELASVPSTGGRPARLLGLVARSGAALGAKVTADHVALVTVELDGSVRTSTVHPFDPRDPASVGDILATGLDDSVLGVGVGVPGSVDTQASGVVDAPTLGWRDVKLGQALRDRLGVPVLVDNDVNTLAAAERLYGVGREHSSYLVVTIGRGVGCGIVIDGAIYRGAAGGAGEIGHIPLSSDGLSGPPVSGLSEQRRRRERSDLAEQRREGRHRVQARERRAERGNQPLCGCGAVGCLEAHIGSAGLLRAARERGVIGPRGRLSTLPKAARDGDASARAVFAEAGRLLGRALAGIVHTLDPEVVVLMGEGVDAWEFWQPGFEPALRGCLLPARRDLPVVVEPWSEDQWARGAASLVLASPFDSAGTGGEQGRMVRARLGTGAS